MFFLMTALIFGCFIVFFLPPFRGLDEASHIYRITQLSEPDIFIEKSPIGYSHSIPDDIHELNINEFTQKTRSTFFDSIERRIESGTRESASSTHQLFEGSGTYSPFIYTHLLPVGLIAKLTNMNAYPYVLLLRLVNLALFLAVVYVCLKIIPTGKWLIVTISLLPMSIHQAATVSADVILYGSILIVISLVVKFLYSYKKNSKFKPKRALLVCLFLASIALCIGKPGYFILLAPLFILPFSLFGTRSNKYIFIISLFTISFAFIAGWNLALSNAGLSGAVESFRLRVDGGELYGLQKVLNMTLLQPWQGLQFFGNSFIRSIDITLPSILGGNYNNSSNFIISNFTGQFASLGIHLPVWTSFTVLLALIFSFCGFSTKRHLVNFQAKIIILLAIVAQFLLIYFLFWVTWTPTYYNFIQGLQGRYFIPLLPLLIFLLPKKSIFSWSDAKSLKILIVLIIIPLLMMVDLIFETFYKGIY